MGRWRGWHTRWLKIRMIRIGVCSWRWAITLPQTTFGLAFRIGQERLDRGITTTRIDWEEGPVEITAEEAMTKDQEQPKGNKRELARHWILVRVSEAAVLAEQLREEVETIGEWSWKTVERAADELEKDKLLHRTVSWFPGKPTWSRAG